MKKIFGFNHISSNLSEEEIEKLKSLYKSYHRLKVCYKMKYKKLRRLKMTLELTSISLTSIGAIAGVLTLNPIILGSISGSGIIIQAYLTKSDLQKRSEMCKFAFSSYDKILIQIKSFLRGINYDEGNFLTDLKIIDDIIIDQCPSIEKYYDKYNKIYN